MTFVDTNDVALAIYNIIEGVIVPIAGEIPKERYEEVAESIKSILGRFTGLRMEDGENRLYEINLLEGEPYVMDA